MYISKFLMAFLLMLAYSVSAQTGHQPTKIYVVYFKDKDTSGFEPVLFFDAKAIARRNKSGLSNYDFSDVPVSKQYLEKLSGEGCRVLVASRWLNAAFIETTETLAGHIKELHFVRNVDQFAPVKKHIASSNDVEREHVNVTKLTEYQTMRFQSEVFMNKKLTGKGIRIAVFDVGFNGVDHHEAFKHMRANNQIKATYDFISQKEDVYHGGSHGTATLSCIGGKLLSNLNLGMAPDAEFLLARTEWNVKENIAEEYFWLAAAEWADKNGADIISSSLGYGETWYEVGDMNGRKSIVAFAATTAARKGILVVNSAGNEFTSEWKMIITPADADSVLCVGGINPYTDRHISFSSSGPSADFRMKPNVSAPGYVFAANPKNYSDIQGTSFSCPLVAGFAACAWQNDTSLSNMQLFRAIEKSGHLYPYFDYMHGYGVPQASRLLKESDQIEEPLFQVLQTDNIKHQFEVQITDSALINKIAQMNGKGYGLNLYWNIQSPDNRLKQYEVISINSSGKIILMAEKMDGEDLLNIHFEGYTYSKKWSFK